MSAVPRNTAFWIASGFGAGLAPKAPGTVGSLVALLPWLALRELSWLPYLLLVATVFLLGVWSAQKVIDGLGAEDPGLVVIDEWVGLWLALFILPLGWIWVLAGFVVFRAFDILKPWPVGWADRRLKGGLGTMVDDALAGVMAWLCLHAVNWGWSALT
ncbi:phosphatidylglycerophosphatase A family protein [Pseudomarimonas arenosa]|uniref:Phosphatidylglycerophosphatase A n=1 Tax=Pseudomarimonas arenosa TaxID=2774145 RepID=A0AAW3ZKS7_9GAMM|nr:phosphatidylglycerophosphatase A [Pseudomarimonas arenosa]MBD8525041.1 phosphatidylglycerophosphatase A [Pseudomarimonas arenosa]